MSLPTVQRFHAPAVAAACIAHPAKRRAQLARFSAALLGCALALACICASASTGMTGSAVTATGPRLSSTSQRAQTAQMQTTTSTAPYDEALYEQMDAASTHGATSQDFETALDADDDQVADDFVIPTGAVWSIHGIDVTGTYQGPGPAESFNVYFYTAGVSVPGIMIASRLAQPYTHGSNAVITFDSPVNLTAGTYWVSVQARMDYASGAVGQWFWYEHTVAHESPAVFENAGNGLGTGCTSWGTLANCTPPADPEMLFRLRGVSGNWIVTSNQDDSTGVQCSTISHQCNTLRDAIFSADDGDTIVFDLPNLPATINLANAEPLNLGFKGLTIHGPGFNQLTISGQNASRVFILPNSAIDVPAATIDHLTITGGIARGEGGLAGSPGTTPGEAGANGLAGDSVGGGCILVGEHIGLHLNFDLVTGCYALAAAGGAGGSGAQGEPGEPGAPGASSQPGGDGTDGGTGGNGGSGGAGGGAYGGAVAAFGSLSLESTTISGSVAAGGPGGDAGTGGQGGDGGQGGTGHLVCAQPGQCLYTTAGGNGGDGGTGGDGGNGGSMGTAAGGAIYAPGPGDVSITNSTLVDNVAIDGFSLLGPGPTGGDGGDAGAKGLFGAGGDGSTDGAAGVAGNLGRGGSGGSGGSAKGGAIYTSNTQGTTLLLHATIAFNTSVAGNGGLGKEGPGSAGEGGQNTGAGIRNEAGTSTTIHNSIIARNDRIDAAGNMHLANCYLAEHENTVVYVNDNLADTGPNTSCFFDTHGDPKFAAPRGLSHAYAWGGNGLPVLMLLPGSPAIGGAKVHSQIGDLDKGGCAVPTDERGMSRPVPAGLILVSCDLGAVEAGNDIIFINGFDTSP